MKRFIVFVEINNGFDDASTVTDGIEFGNAVFGAIFKINDFVLDIEIFIKSVDGHFGFNFKTFSNNRESFNESIAESAISSHNISNVAVVD